jgi:hypothetical protein
MVRLLVSLLFLAFLGCAHPDVSELMHQNQLNLQKLRVGMTKADAMETMGTRSAQTNRGPIANPIRSETFSRNYRDTTPLVFKGGVLVGWGPEALRQAR